MTKDEYKLLMARLNVIDAGLECVIKRQGTLARMIVDHPNRSDYAVGMSKALDDYIEAIEKIKKEHGNERD